MADNDPRRLLARIHELEEQLAYIASAKENQQEELREVQYLAGYLRRELESTRTELLHANANLAEANHAIHVLENHVHEMFMDNHHLVHMVAALQPPPAPLAEQAPVQGNSGLEYEAPPTPETVMSEAGSCATPPPPLVPLTPAVDPTPEELAMANAMRATMKQHGYHVTSIYPKVD